MMGENKACSLVYLVVSSNGLSEGDQRVSTALDSYHICEILYLVSIQIKHMQIPHEAL